MTQELEQRRQILLLQIAYLQRLLSNSKDQKLPDVHQRQLAEYTAELAKVEDLLAKKF